MAVPFSGRCHLLEYVFVSLMAPGGKHSILVCYLVHLCTDFPLLGHITLFRLPLPVQSLFPAVVLPWTSQVPPHTVLLTRSSHLSCGLPFSCVLRNLAASIIVVVLSVSLYPDYTDTRVTCELGTYLTCGIGKLHNNRSRRTSSSMRTST